VDHRILDSDDSDDCSAELQADEEDIDENDNAEDIEPEEDSEALTGKPLSVYEKVILFFFLIK